MRKIVFCYAALQSRLIEKNVTHEELAAAISIPESTLKDKLSTGLPFKIKQIKIICRILDISQSDIGKYFFRE